MLHATMESVHSGTKIIISGEYSKLNSGDLGLKLGLQPIS